MTAVRTPATSTVTSTAHGARPALARRAPRWMRSMAAALLAALFVVAGVSRSAALAQDAATGDELQRRVQWLRDLPPEERAKLKAKLESFRDLPQETRDKLRRRAAKLGPERLDGLAGRDLRKVASRFASFDVEIDRVMSLLGAEQLAALGPDERAYLRAEALRGFQRHLQRRVLNAPSYDEWERLPREERRARTRLAVRHIVDSRLAKLPDEERARIRALPPKDAAAEEARIFAEYRMDETLEFARIFGRFRVERFVRLSPAERAETVRVWRERSRWPQLLRVLKEDIGIGDDVRRELASLGPGEWAKVMAEVRTTEAMPLEDRRTRIEQTIRRLAGERSLDAEARASRVPRFLERIRERRLRD